MARAARAWGLLLLVLARPGSAGARDEVVFTGACDVSAAVALDASRFLAADDEDSVLRLYDARTGGAPLATFDLAPSLGLARAPEARRAPETDLEAAVRVGARVYWLTSHARNRSGERKAARRRFFATNAPDAGDAVRVVGTPYERLLDDLVAAPQLARFALARAAALAPKEPGGLNLEGLALRPEGGLWLGFRSPVPEGRALLVPLLEPERMLEGGPARLGEPLRLDLGGLGVRALGAWRGRGLILAGSPDASDAAPRLFLWNGRDARATAVEADLDGLTPEALVAFDASERALVLSDDGTRALGGKPCKRLRDPARKRFRGAWLALAPR